VLAVEEGLEEGEGGLVVVLDSTIFHAQGGGQVGDSR
jgi:Ser-tRNA(Ala) deacylase AlaX